MADNTTDKDRERIVKEACEAFAEQEIYSDKRYAESRRAGFKLTPLGRRYYRLATAATEKAYAKARELDPELRAETQRAERIAEEAEKRVRDGSLNEFSEEYRDLRQPWGRVGERTQLFLQRLCNRPVG